MARNNYLKFDIAVRDYYGSNNTAIAFSRLLYWFGKKPDGFYKFKQACRKHPLYKKGDSWGEELGMSRKVLDPIFSRLVNHHSTKRDFLKQADKFKGKMFASYTNHKTNQTYYFIDCEAVQSFLSSLSVSHPIQSPLPSSSDVPQPVDNLAKESKIVPSNQCSDVPIAPPLAHARQTAINTQTNTSLSRSVPREVIDPEKEKEKLSSKKMVELWNSHTQDMVAWYPSTASRLHKVLADFFGGCLEAFRKYCAAIGNTKFLMGKAPNSKFKAFFYWAIKPEVIKSIFQGAYGVKDILSKIGNESEAEKLENEYNTISYDIQKAKDKIEYSKKQVIETQEKDIREHQQTISQQAKDDILKTVQEEVSKTYDLCAYSQTEKGWLINPKYHFALVDYSRAQLNLCKLEEIVVPQALLNEQKRLEDRRISICKRLQEIVKENHKEQQRIETLIEKAA